MADLLARASEWLEDVCRQHLAEAVVYERDGWAIEVTATRSYRRYDVTDEYGASVRADSTDFLVLADDLRLAGERFAPQAGDRIRVRRGEAVDIYEVMAPGAGMSAAEPADPYTTAWRIHTKHVLTEAA